MYVHTTCNEDKHSMVHIIPQEAIQSRALNASGNRKAVELTLLSTNLSHSGLYQCVADNSFQKLKGSISLTIYPAGMSREALYTPLYQLHVTQ